MEIIKINVIEAASELAHKRLVEYAMSELGIQDEDDLMEDNDGCLTYKDDIQDIFNGFYDEFYEYLTNCSINE